MRDFDLRHIRPGRACHMARIVALLGIAGAILLSVLIRPPNSEDLATYYMGGVMAREGGWDQLYPSNPTGTSYAIFEGATIPPELLRRATELGVPPVTPYLHPPWNALLWAPVVGIPYRWLLPLFLLLCIICATYCAHAAGVGYRLLVGKHTYAEAVIVLACAASPLVYRSVRVTNVSTVVAACVAFALLGNFTPRKRDVRDALAVWLAGILKYAGVAFIPLLILTKRTRLLTMLAALGVLAVAVSVPFVPRSVWAYYLHDVAASLPRSSPMPTNQSVWGLILRTTGVPLTPTARHFALALQLTLWSITFVFMWRRRACNWRSPEMTFAALGASTCLMLAFAPVFWEHYAMYLLPMTGWLWWETGEVSRAWRSAARAGLIVCLFPVWAALPALTWFRPAEPFGTSLLLSILVVYVVAMTRIWHGENPGGSGQLH